MNRYFAFFIFTLWYLNIIAHCEDIAGFHLDSDSKDDQGYRHFNITSGITHIQIAARVVSDAKDERIVLIIPGKTDTGLYGASLSDRDTRILEGMCQGESTCVVDWEKGTKPYYAQGQTTNAYADSIITALEFLQRKRLIAISKLGIIAHSEGALAAMMLANQVKPRPCFIVLLAPPGIRGDELTLIQNDDGSRNIPSKLNDSLLRNQFDRLRKIPDLKKVEIAFEDELNLSYGNSVDRSQIHSTAVKFSSPWMKAFIDIDPFHLISNLRCSWVAIWGSDDTIIRPDRNILAYKLASGANGNSLGEVMLIDGYDHFFERTKPPDSAMYLGINDTVRAWYVGKWHE